MTIFSDALAAGFAAIETVAAETVSYFRGSNYELSDISAVRGQSEFEEVAIDESRVLVRTVDFLIRKELLVDGSDNVFEPSRGDYIITADGEEYEVIAGGSNHSWRWSDSRKTHLRIHTVRRVES